MLSRITKGNLEAFDFATRQVWIFAMPYQPEESYGEEVTER